MVKYFLVTALTIVCAWGTTQLVVGSEQARDECNGEWCVVQEPGGTIYLCCPLGGCPTNGGRECESE